MNEIVSDCAKFAGKRVHQGDKTVAYSLWFDGVREPVTDVKRLEEPRMDFRGKIFDLVILDNIG